MPTTRVQLFRGSQPLITPAVKEPCLALIRNDAVMNLLIAGAALGQGTGLMLEQVAWFCAHRDHSLTRRLAAVRLSCGADAIWRSMDCASDKLIRQPSRIPYHVIFIAEDERQRLLGAISVGDGMTVFRAAQDSFGTLPGFDFADEVLISPPGYATATAGMDSDFLSE